MPTDRQRRPGVLGALVMALLAALLVLAGCSSGSGDPEATATAPARTTGSPAAIPTRYDRYVALGDSYTAAPLVPPTDTSTFCLRSHVNYPALVTRQLPGATLTDVSCSGATTANMVAPQQGRDGTVPPQFDALTPDTDLVTVGIGGNDYGLFADLVGHCTELGRSDPTGSPCRTAFADGSSDRLTESLDDIEGHVAAVVRGIRERSPHARILVVGYPQIVPASGTCQDLLPLATGDYPWARQVNEGLTRALEAAARETGAEYVDVWSASAGHDICARDPWINGWVTSADRALAFHPLAVEQQAVADLVLDRLRG